MLIMNSPSHDSKGQLTQTYNVLENCRKGAYPLPSEKDQQPRISKEDALQHLRRSYTLEQESQKEGIGLLAKAQKAQMANDNASAADLFVQQLVVKLKPKDQFFVETGIEHSELDRAVKKYFQEDH